MAAVAIIPPKAPQTLLPQSRNSTIGTIAIPMVATSIITTQTPPVCNPVSITNIPPPGPTLWVVTTRGYIKLYSQVPLANAPRLLNQPRHPPTTLPPLQCHLATMDHGSQHVLPAALGLRPACSCLPTRQQHSPSPTRNIHDGKYHGVQLWVQLSGHHARTSCIRSAQSWSTFLPEPLLTVRGG
jgi:hypothetical protein